MYYWLQNDLIPSHILRIIQLCRKVVNTGELLNNYVTLYGNGTAGRRKYQKIKTQAQLCMGCN